MRLLRVFVVVLVVALLVWFHDFKSPPTRDEACSPYVTSNTEKLAHGSTRVGDILHQLKDDATAWTHAQIDEAIKGAGLVVGIVWRAFKLASKVGKVKADQAVTGMVPTPVNCAPCPADTSDGGDSGSGKDTWDPRDAALSQPLAQVGASWSTPEGVARTAARRYFPASQVNMAVAVAGAESHWRSVRSPRNRNGSYDHGFWQINTVHKDLLAAKDWRDPYANAWMAYQVWARAGKSWRPWTTFNSGSYKRFLREGATDALRAETPDPACSTTPGAPASPGLTGGLRRVKDPSSGKSYNITIPAGPRGVAINFALDQLGDPYRFGAHGPDRWDCSGIVSAAWGKAGVRFTPQTLVLRRQLQTTKAPQPGDLAWKYGHVQMMLGGGLVLEAPRTGLRVRIVRQWMRPTAFLDPTMKKGLMV